MKKPASLRAALVAANPDLAENPDRLLVFIKSGRTVPAAKGSLSFCYEYTLNLLVLDYTADSDLLMLPMLEWARTNQPDLFTDPVKIRDGFIFEAELLDNQAMDISIELMLSERVGVVELDGKVTSVTHLDEPYMVEETGPVNWSLIIIPEQLTL